MSEIIRHPNVMAQLQEELKMVVADNNVVEEAHLSKLHYLYMVVKESLRLHPVGPLSIPRESMEDIVIDGYYIPKKSRIILNADVWSDNADEFIPERFTGSKIDVHGRDFELTPFGCGRRKCPGTSLGLINIQLVVAQLVHCFDWELPNGKLPTELDMDEKFGLTMKKLDMDDDVDYMEKEEEGDPIRKGKQKMNNSDVDDDFNREEKMNINDDSDTSDNINDVNRKEKFVNVDDDYDMSFEKKVLITMGDPAAPTKALIDYSQPKINDIRFSIVRPAIAANTFEIKPDIIQMICDTFRFNGVSEDAVKLRLFPLSLRDKAKSWLHSLPAGSIATWEELAQKFLTKFFHMAKTTAIRNALTQFAQKSGESLCEA
ncbi:hypothetical protein AgCh_012801 [Apium graveolens]